MEEPLKFIFIIDQLNEADNKKLKRLTFNYNIF
jgi:hypothetical protein